jgi:hypothetical protein
MELNNRLFKGTVILIGILALASLVAMLQMRLDKPVFLDHYYDLRVHKDGNYHQEFRLTYITNVHDSRVVNHVEFPEHPYIRVSASEQGFMSPFSFDSSNQQPPGEVHGRYSVRTVYCQIDALAGVEEMDGTVVRTARIFFNDGSRMDVPIGELHFYSFGFEDSSFDSVSSSGSSDGSSSSRYRAREDVTLLSVENQMLERFEHRLDLKINDHAIDGIHGLEIKWNEHMTIRSKLYPGSDPLDVYTMVDIHPELYFKRSDGQTESMRFYNIDSIYHGFNFMDLYRYLKAREVL